MALERLQKVLARGGIASRRAAEKIITEGRVRVNGKVVQELGAKADPFKDKIEIDGTRVVAEKPVYVVLHKPRGVVSTMSDPEGRPSVKEILAPVGARVFPVGRLDFATSGVLLATNDGEFADGLMHPKRAVPKTYVVKVQGTMQVEDLDRWRDGVRLEDGMTLPALAKLIRYEGTKTWLELTIREGRNQQIRRMGEATRFPVMRLARVSFAGITAEGLRPGEWRAMTREELMALKKEYGVPKRIVAPVEEQSGRAQRARAPWPKERAKEKTGERSGDRAARGAKSTKATGDRSWPKPKPKAARSGRTHERAPSSNEPDRGGPRYGGGSPGRRGYDVREDWGGGAGRGRTDSERAPRESAGTRRGSSGSESARDSGPPRADVGGRGGHSRTTGTGGGIGASGGDYRGRSRRGR